jgi:hypothetical protein
LWGGILGFAVGYAILSGPGNAAVTSTAIGVVAFLALVAPYADRWLSRATNVKTAFLELQLASAVSHPIAVAEESEQISNTQSLKKLSEYKLMIREDIEYMDNFEVPLLTQLAKTTDPDDDINNSIEKRRRDITGARELLPVFDELISPLAECLRQSIANGLSIDSLRQSHILRPIANIFSEIVFNQDNDNFSSVERKKQQSIMWEKIYGVAKEELISAFLKAQKIYCTGLADKYKIVHENYPFIDRMNDLPYLYTAASYFFSFLGDNDAALHILSETRHRGRLSYYDESFLYNIAKFSLYQGAAATHTVPIYRQVRAKAVKRQKTIDDRLQDCQSQKCDNLQDLTQKAKKLKQRAREIEVDAMNGIAYVVAEDLARGLESAKSFQATAEQYANEVREAAKAIREASKTRDDEFRAAYLEDTYAYVTMVLEAGKAHPDVKRFEDSAKIFQKIIERFQQDIDERRSNNELINKSDFNYLRIVRTHLATSRQLAGE